MVKNFIVRLLVYPFCAFMIFWGYKMSFETSNYTNSIYFSRAKLSGIGLMIVATVYLVTDIAYQIKKVYFKKND